jgi:hypothetical protein
MWRRVLASGLLILRSCDLECRLTRAFSCCTQAITDPLLLKATQDQIAYFGARRALLFCR